MAVVARFRIAAIVYRVKAAAEAAVAAAILLKEGVEAVIPAEFASVV